MPSQDLPLEAARALAQSQMAPEIQAFFDADTYTVSYVVRDPASNACAIIDSVLDFDPASGRTSHASADKIIEHVKREGLAVDWILETHAHADHLSAAPYLQEKLGGKIAIGANITAVQRVFGALFGLGDDFSANGLQFDHLFQDGDRFWIGEMEAIVLHTPGHTPACVSYVIGDAVFVGDTLFMPDYGSARCDFPGGDAATLFKSVRRLLSLRRERGCSSATTTCRPDGPTIAGKPRSPSNARTTSIFTTALAKPSSSLSVGIETPPCPCPG